MTKENWAVIGRYRYPVARVVKETPEYFVLTEGPDRERRTHKTSVIATGLSADAAAKLSAQMTVAEAERDRRRLEANRWFERCQNDLVADARALSAQVSA